MDETETSDAGYSELYQQLLHYLANFLIGKNQDDIYGALSDKINALNAAIDSQKGNKSEQYFLLVDLCYQFYRIRDALKSMT